MEGDPPRRVPIKICFTNIYICSLAQAEALPRGVILINCISLGLDADFENLALHIRKLANYVMLADQMARYQLHMADRIYVHCEAGKVRSVTAVGIYLMRCGGLTLDQVWALLVQSLGNRWRDRFSQGIRVRGWLEAYIARYP